MKIKLNYINILKIKILKLKIIKFTTEDQKLTYLIYSELSCLNKAKFTNNDIFFKNYYQLKTS